VDLFVLGVDLLGFVWLTEEAGNSVRADRESWL
jgi:hypothetical protein